MKDKKYTTKEMAEAISHAGQVIAKKQLLEDALAWNDASWEDRRPTQGEVIGYRAELRGYLKIYESTVPQEVQAVLRESGVINPDKIRQMVSGEALPKQLQKSRSK